MFLDLTFVPLLEKLQPELPNVKAFIVLTDAKHMPSTPLCSLLPTVTHRAVCVIACTAC